MKMLKSKRLFIFPMSDDELRAAILSETDEHMKNAYHEMLQGSLSFSEERNWYTAWKITLHDGTVIGDLCFKGPPQNGAVEIGYGINEEYRSKGYATEAVRQAIQWAFSNDNVYFVTAETEGNNLASKRVLVKLGFSPCGTGKEGDIYEKEREKTSWMAIFMCLGLSCGLSIGTGMDNTGIGMSIGMCLGLAVGLSLDDSDRKKREKLRETRKNI